MQCQCLAMRGSAVSVAVDAPDPEGPDRDLTRLGNRSDLLHPGDTSARVYHVHLHAAYAPGAPTLHLVKIGKQAGVHMCDCLELAHRGLPCRHYFAVLLHDQSIRFDLDVIHPRWFIRSSALSSLPVRSDPSPPELPSPEFTARVKEVQYFSKDALRESIEVLDGNVRGLKSKADYAKRLVSLEQAALGRAPVDQQPPAVTPPVAARTEINAVDMCVVSRYTD